MFSLCLHVVSPGRDHLDLLDPLTLWCVLAPLQPALISCPSEDHPWISGATSLKQIQPEVQGAMTSGVATVNSRFGCVCTRTKAELTSRAPAGFRSGWTSTCSLTLVGYPALLLLSLPHQHPRGRRLLFLPQTFYLKVDFDLQKSFKDSTSFSTFPQSNFPYYQHIPLMQYICHSHRINGDLQFLRKSHILFRYP